MSKAYPNAGSMIKGRFVATHRHYKGGLYQLVCFGVLESEMAQAVAYRDSQGQIWFRSLKDFNEDVIIEGEAVRRFSPIEPHHETREQTHEHQ